MMRHVILLLFAVAMFVAPSACGWTHAAPSWIMGGRQEYPSERYLVGVGQADSQAAADERAYGAVAKIFKAEISAQSRDWESFLSLEKRGQTDTEHRLSLDQVTKVSSDKVLENVRVLDRWVDDKHGQHYTLAGMDRAQAAAAIQERMAELDRAVDTELAESQQTTDKLAKVRNVRRAIKHLILREAYNADLRVIRVSGQGDPPAHRVADLTVQLEQFLADSLPIAVEVSGDQVEQTRRAVTEGLIREGLPVIAVSADGHANGESAPRAAEMLVKGEVHLWEVAVPDPRFRYARWCSDFVITEIATQRVVGAVSLGGREGHITSSEAMARAFRVMQQELSSHLAKTLAAYVYGESPAPTDLPPAACPGKDR